MNKILKNILNLYNNISNIINNVMIKFFVNHQLINLLCLLMILNLKKIKEVLPKKKIKYKVIVLSKSAGIDDLICSQQMYNKDTLYLNLSRSFFIQIYMTIFDIKEKKKNNFKLKGPKKLEKKYIDFLIKFLNLLKTKYQFNAFIGFNFYPSENNLHKACNEVKIPFILLYKEGVATEYEKKYAIFTFKKTNFKFYGTKIAVYSNDIKQTLIKSNVVNKNQVEVVGCSRLSKSFIYKNKVPKNQILYYVIQKDRGLPYRFIDKYGKKFFKDLDKNTKKKPKLNWGNKNAKTLKVLIKFAKKNPKIKIVIKIKTGTPNDETLYFNYPKNIKIHRYGVGHNLLDNSKVVIGWNSTALMEGIAANRLILLPYFHSKKNTFKNEHELTLKLKDENYGYSEKDLYKKLDYLINKKYNKNIIYNNQYSLKYYLGNEDNMANLRLDKFIKKNLNC